MEELKKAQASVEHAKRELGARVLEAREQGHTWAEIGETLGMTRQAAFKRFGKVTNPATGQLITGAPLSIAAIKTLTEHVFDLISAGDYEKLEQLMHPDVRSELPESMISDTWARVLVDVGAKESYSDTHVAFPAGEKIDDDDQILGSVVGVTTINCEAGDVMGRVAVDEQQRIVGLLLVSPDHSPLPF